MTFLQPQKCEYVNGLASYLWRSHRERKGKTTGSWFSLPETCRWEELNTDTVPKTFGRWEQPNQTAATHSGLWWRCCNMSPSAGETWTSKITRTKHRSDVWDANKTCISDFLLTFTYNILYIVYIPLLITPSKQETVLPNQINCWNKFKYYRRGSVSVISPLQVLRINHSKVTKVVW